MTKSTVLIVLGLACVSMMLVSCSDVSSDTKPSQLAAKKQEMVPLEGALEQLDFEKDRPTLDEAKTKYVVHPTRGILGVLEAAFIALKQEDYFYAEILASEVLKHDEKNAQAYVIRGKARCNAVSGADDAAIKDLEKAIELGYSDSTVYKYLSRLYFHRKNSKKALAALDYAIKLNPDEKDSYKYRAAIWVAVGQKQKALADYKKVLKFDPDNSDTYYMRAQLFESMKKYDAAFNDYGMVVKLEKVDENVPIKNMAYKRRAAILSSNGEHVKAGKELTAAMAFDRFDEELFYLRGKQYAEKGEYQRAVSDYNRAIGMAPELKDAFEARAVAYEKMGEFDLARADREEAKRLAEKPAEQPIYQMK